MGTRLEKVEKVADTKKRIKEAIIKKGGENITDVFATYPDAIFNIVSKGGTMYDWLAIGYTYEPEFIQEGFNHALEVKLGWNPETTDITKKHMYDYKLIFLPNANFSKVVNGTQAFYNSNILAVSPVVKFDSLKIADQMFAKTPMFDCPTLFMPKVESMNQTFMGCKQLFQIDKQDTSLVTNFNGTFQDCTKLRKIEEIDFASCQKIDSSFISGCSNLRYMFIKNFGDKNTQYRGEIDLTGTKWGVDGEGIVNCAQSVRDTLATYSVDRRSEGLPSLNIVLNKEAYQALSSIDKNEMQQKGLYVSRR